jgi:hypothetical protein
MDTPSIPLKCTHCDGQGQQVFRQYGLYPNGWRTVAKPCTHCVNGNVVVLESKVLATGDAA